jgi:hypothetical protein
MTTNDLKSLGLDLPEGEFTGRLSKGRVSISLGEEPGSFLLEIPPEFVTEGGIQEHKISEFITIKNSPLCPYSTDNIPPDSQNTSKALGYLQSWESLPRELQMTASAADLNNLGCANIWCQADWNEASLKEAEAKFVKAEEKGVGSELETIKINHENVKQVLKLLPIKLNIPVHDTSILKEFLDSPAGNAAIMDAATRTKLGEM